MSIKQRRDSGAWEVTVCLPNRPIVRKSNKDWTKRDAQRVEYELLNPQASQGHTLDQAIEKWKAEHVVHMKSAKATLEHAHKLQEYTAGRALDDAPAVGELIKQKMAKLKPATINRRLAILRQICYMAHDRWHPAWLEHPLGQKIKLLPENNERHFYLTRAQVEALAFACVNREAADLIVFAAFTGLRKSEMFRMTADHVVNNALLLNANTKNGRPSMLPLHPRALHIALKLPLTITPKILRDEWTAVRKTCNLKHIHWHDLRHTYASWLVQAGVSLLEVKELMRHATIHMTMRYAHLAPDNLRAAVAKLAN